MSMNLDIKIGDYRIQVYTKAKIWEYFFTFQCFCGGGYPYFVLATPNIRTTASNDDDF